MENTPLYFKENVSKYQIPLDHIDFAYIKKCKDVKELEKIYKLLRSGEEGHYAELEECCEEKLREMHPNSRALRREEPLKKITDLSQEENIALQAELENWSSNMCKLDGSLKKKCSKKAVDDIPPIRSTEGKKIKSEKEKKKGPSKKSSPKPREIREWDKFDVDGELKMIDEEVKEKPAKKVNSEISNLSENVDISNDCLEETKTTHALREKDKGNDAFRSGDYNEAVIYYNRSLSIKPLDVVYNNRALAYLKLSLWNEAIADCDRVLKNDSNNVKALLRRASAYKENKECNKSVCDLKTVLNLEPENQRAKQILSAIEKDLDFSSKEKETPTSSKKKGRKLVIEEIEGNEDEVSPDINRNFLANNFQNGKDAKEESPEKCDKVQETSKKNTDAGKQTSAKCNGKESKQRKNFKNKLDAKVNAEDGKQISENGVSNSCVKEADKNVTDVRASGDCAANNLVNDQNAPNKLKDSSSQHCDSHMKQDTKSTGSNEQSPKVYIHQPLSPKILSMKNSGNDLFLRGRYSEALDYYTKVIDLLEQESIDQTVNLSLIYSNRAACSLKMGQCRNSISDCTTSLKLVPYCVKPLLRRAAAYETLEKYDMAYVDYRYVLAINNTVESALQGSSRCSQILIQQHGYSWRNKLQDIVPIKSADIPVIKQLSESDGLESSKPSAATVKAGGGGGSNKKSAEKQNKNEPGKSNKTQTPNVEKATVAPLNVPKTLSKEEEFDEMKAQGNQFVKDEQYLKAIDCYSQCIKIFPDNAISYRNRALCYLKLNKASEAASDCDESLHLEPNNIKTLFRRAQAHKLLKNYRASISDLKNLLNLDPENSTAKKELEIGKNLWRQELNAMKANMDDNKTTKNCNKCSQESRPTTSPGSNKKNSKQRTRLHVHDVEDDNSQKSSSKLHGKHHKNSKKSEGKILEGSQSAGINNSSKKNRSSSEVAGPTPVSAPHIDKATPYEFLKAWNSLKTLNNTKPYADLLAQITPKDLPMVISNKLDASMLNLIIQCVSEHYADKDSAEVGLEYLINLTKVARFQTIAMFLSSKEKSDLVSLINTLAANQSTSNEAEILALRQDYGLK